MDRKASLDLSMNMLVIILISISILILGVSFLFQFLSPINPQINPYQAELDHELELLLIDQGKQVALPLHVATIQAGDSHIFRIGILNSDKKFGTQFTIHIELNKALNKNKEEMTDKVKESSLTWLLYTSEPLTLEENEHQKESILIDIPTNAPKGQYIYNVIIKTKDNQQYGSTQKMIVNVN